MLKQRSTAYMHLGRYDNAIADQKTLLEMSRSDVSLRPIRACLEYGIGWNNAQLGEFHEAIRWFESSSESPELASHASEWLGFLRALTQENDNEAPGQPLPGFCVYLKTTPTEANQ